ncbi:MAG: GDSL-type esterase/lipase family protein [bacterium]
MPDYFPRYRTVNRGLSEQRLAGYLLRFRPDVIDLKPRAVVIEFSSYNFRPENTLAENKDYLVSLAELARANGIEPILTTVLPVRNELYYEGYSVQDSLVVFNRWLTAFCRDHDYRLVDFNTIVADADGFLRAELSTGHIELNHRGYDAISEATRTTLPSPD